MGGAGAAEEVTLGQQILVRVHALLCVLAADQAAIEGGVCRARQVHPVVALEDTFQSESYKFFNPLESHLNS